MIAATPLVLFTASAHAEPSWYPQAVACGQWAETHICVGKAGCPSWQWAFNCIVEKTTPAGRLPAIKGRVSYCTATVAQQRAQQGLFANQGNPLGEAMTCLRGGSF